MTNSPREVNLDLDGIWEKNSREAKQHEQLEKLSFVDFCPETNSSYMKSFFTKPETYGELIQRANEWLQEHPQWQVRTVESILFDPISKIGKLVVYTANAEQQRKLFALRLWICPRENTQQPIQRLKVLNIIPKVKITGCQHEAMHELQKNETAKFSSLELPTYESIDDLVDNLNRLLVLNKYFGTILNVETIAMPLRSNRWSVDTEQLDWPADCRGVLNILRVHFNDRLFTHETLEIVDFVPSVETWNAPLAVPNLESFTHVLKRASHVLRERTDQYRFLCCKTLSCPTNSVEADQGFLDPKRTFYPNSEWTNSATFAAKYVRIVLAKPVEKLNNKESHKATLLNCKIFVPMKRRKNDQISTDHGMQTIKEAIESWFNKTGAKVLSVETEMIASSITWTSSTTLIDSCLSLNKYPCDLLVLFKVYIDGYYVEPSKQSKNN